MKQNWNFLLSVVWLVPAFAAEITFDSEHYRPGERLWGQGEEGLIWQGTSNPAYSVEEGAGVEGSRGVLVRKRNLDYEAVSLTPASSVLGGFDPAASALRYGISFRMEETGGEGLCARLRFAGQAVQMELYNDGRLLFMHGEDASPHRSVRDGKDEAFRVGAGEWFRVEVVADFKRKTYRLRVNGVDQAGGEWIPMRGVDEGTGGAPELWIAAWLQKNPEWKSFSFDDVSISPVRLP